MMKKILFVSLCALLMVFAATSLKAQNSMDRWKYDDYFPDDYFSTDPTDYRKHVHVGEVVYYMRLADITPLFEEKQGAGDTLLRLNYIPKFAHPLFIQVRRHHDQIRLEWQKGTAFRGYISSSMYMEPSDTGYVDATEKQYYGNSWEKGILDSGGRELTREEWNRIRQILTDIDFVHYKHLNGCWGFRTPFLLEYADHKKTVAHYTECPDEAKEGRLAKLLVSLVDPQYEDMVVYSVNEKNGIIKPEYPGGEAACKQFVETSVRYPDDALRDMVEFTAYLDVIIEKDGSVGYVRDDSWPKSPYGFADELIRVVKSMPKWKPAIRKGDTVRCYAHITHKFTLPEKIRPKYGNPVLESQRDKIVWDRIEECHRQLLLNPSDKGAAVRMGCFYYGEFLLENAPVTVLDATDSMFYQAAMPNENDWSTFHDRTPVVSHPGDSALKYLYQALQLNPDTETLINLCLPILQLEYNLKKTHNPLAELPYDTVEGVHFPYSYFVNRPENGAFDNSTDYLGETSSSFFWVDAFSKDLTKMQEPVLYNNQLQEDETIFRFSFFPSFHPPVSFRVVKNNRKMTLYWKILLTKYDPNTWKEISTTVKTGHREMTAAQYEKLLQYMEAVRLDELPRSKYVMMLDGAQWVMERMTDQGFKAHFTNVAGNDIQQVYSFLAKLSGEKLKYIEEYY
jgi:hypothetical protein